MIGPDTRKMAARLPRSRVADLAFWGGTCLTLLYALAVAWHRHWVCDDAFISFRYAENLVRGLGLIFNPGERVEGYSNFLWTLWTALGLRLGADAEEWAITAGIVCYLGALAALAWNAWSSRREFPGLAPWIPIAAGLGALHTDWNFFATGGLETSLFALEITLVYVVLARSPVTPARAVGAGLLLGLVAMTRPDGPIFAAGAALFVMLAEPRRVRTLALLVAAFLVVWGPYTAWRVNYYGDFFPNTYYAKSGNIAWYSQGAVYIALYFERYWPLLVGIGLAFFAWPRTGREADPAANAALEAWRRRVLLAVALALPYMAMVLRVGGDFMFARFLIPVTPLLLVVFELALARLTSDRVRTQWLAAGLAGAAVLFTPYPFPQAPTSSVRGIVREQHFYGPKKAERMRQKGLTLRPYLEGLPVRVAYFGGEARLVYYARPMIAIECVTGLTDHHIARQPLKSRGRVGHEKLVSIDYLLDDRRAHVTFFWNAANALHLDREVPPVTIDMGGIRGKVLTWDPAVLDSLRGRGAVIQDFPGELDRLLREPSMIFRWVDWLAYAKVRRFYFDQAPDPQREALLRQRIQEASRL